MNEKLEAIFRLNDLNNWMTASSDSEEQEAALRAILLAHAEFEERWGKGWEENIDG